MEQTPQPTRGETPTVELLTLIVIIVIVVKIVHTHHYCRWPSHLPRLLLICIFAARFTACLSVTRQRASHSCCNLPPPSHLGVPRRVERAARRLGWRWRRVKNTGSEFCNQVHWCSVMVGPVWLMSCVRWVHPTEPPYMRRWSSKPSPSPRPVWWRRCGRPVRCCRPATHHIIILIVVVMPKRLLNWALVDLFSVDLTLSFSCEIHRCRRRMSGLPHTSCPVTY